MSGCIHFLNKRAYPCVKAAAKAAADVWWVSGNRAVLPYLCPSGEHWHIGKKTSSRVTQDIGVVRWQR